MSRIGLRVKRSIDVLCSRSCEALIRTRHLVSVYVRWCDGGMVDLKLRDQAERRKRNFAKFVGVAVIVALLILSLLGPAF